MTQFWALTIWQPWATMIMAGWKPFEFRGWRAPTHLIGQEMAVHAGARPIRPVEIRDLIYKLERGGDVAKATGLIRHEEILPWAERLLAAPKSLPMSSILGYATVGEPIRDDDLARRLGVGHVNDSDRNAHSNWGWPLSNVRQQVPMVPASGQRGLWIWKKSPSWIDA